MLKKMDNLMASLKMAELSEVNHGKNEHTALGRGLCFCLLLCVACSFQCWMLHLFACLSCAGYILVFSLELRISRVIFSVGRATVLNCFPLDYWPYWPVGSSVLTGRDFFSIYFFKYCHGNLGWGMGHFLCVLSHGWMGKYSCFVVSDYPH